MPQFVDRASNGPYQNFRIRIRWQGRHVAGFSKISALKETAAMVHREEENHESRKIHSPAKFEAVTFERGLTCDSEFARWANAANHHSSRLGAGPSLNDLRQDVVIEVYDEAGQVMFSYKVFTCWVSKFQALPQFDRDANAIGIESLKLENEGWEMIPDD